MRVFNSRDWEYVGFSERGFLFSLKGSKYEVVEIHTACLDLGNTRVYFDWDRNMPRIRVPKNRIDTFLLEDYFNLGQYRVSNTEDSIFMYAKAIG